MRADTIVQLTRPQVPIYEYPLACFKLGDFLRIRYRADHGLEHLSIPEHLKESLHTVCCDMYEGFSEAVRVELPQARIVIDRFHVACGSKARSVYRQGVDELRKQELRRRKAELPASEYQQLKGNLWAVRKKPADLTAEERRCLRFLFRYSPP